MPVCEVCGEEKEKVYACRMCGIHFCDECGYPDQYLCFSCGDEVSESLEDEADDTFEES